MYNKITLQEAIDGVLKCQREANHTESYLVDLRRTYNRLLKLAAQCDQVYLS